MSKDDLLAAVWRGRVVSESALFNRINAARTAEAFRRAVSLNPNSAIGRFHLGHGLAFAAEDRMAIEHAEDAMRLSPLDPMMAQFMGAIAVAHFAATRNAEALHHMTEAARLRPGSQGAKRLGCATLALTGRLDEARAHLAAVRRDQPHLTSACIRTNVPYRRPS